MRNRILSTDRERRSVRYPRYDYSTPGAYSITVCTHERKCLFGEIRDGEMILNEFGNSIAREWMRTSEARPYVVLDEFVVMPNHFHGIIWLVDPPGRGVLQYAPTECRSPSIGIGAIVRGWKSTTTKYINGMRQTPGTPIWQRSYHDRIIRTEAELNAFREYIRLNPSKWQEDEYA